MNTDFRQEMNRALAKGSNLYQPIEVVSFQPERRRTRASTTEMDGELRLRLSDKEIPFVVEVKPRTAPKIVQEGIWRLKSLAESGRNLLLVVPYLSDTILEMTKRERISCLDLSGNYFIQTKGLLAIRRDQPNRFKESKPIKQVYSGSSSIVGRFLLMAKETYGSVNEVFNAIRELGGAGGKDPISLPTLSKVLSSLEEDLIIEKQRNKIRILQPEKLLDNLRKGYRPPKITNELGIKAPNSETKWWKELTGIWVFSGESSVQKYAATTAPQTLTLYVADLPYVTRTAKIERYAEERFPNFILKETTEAFVYFGDKRKENGWASPMECYFELSQMDKREREIAEEIRKDILQPFL